MVGGRGLQSFRTSMVNDKHIKKLVDYEDAIEDIHTDKTKTGAAYTLSGRRATNRDRGILVREGKKIVIK